MLLAAMAANTLITLAILLVIRDMTRVDLARFAMVVLGAGAIQVALAAGGRTLEAVAQRAYEARSALAEAATARAAAERVHADRQRRYREIGQAVRELLSDLAAGRLDTADPQVQRRCAVEAARLRRLIAEHDDTPDPLIHELRACADVAERRGVAVSLHTAGEAAGAVGRAAPGPHRSPDACARRRPDLGQGHRGRVGRPARDRGQRGRRRRPRRNREGRHR